LNKIFLILTLLIQLDEEKLDETGIYLPIKCTRHDTKYQVLLTSKEVCLASKPIISYKEFSKISNLNEIGDQVYFDLTFSTKEYGVLSKLNESFPYIDLALVVEDEVFIVFTAADRKLNQTFRFQSNINSGLHFKKIHSKLANLVEE
jgi:hypothetical protein